MSIKTLTPADTKTHYEYLDNLRESGITNMWGSATYLEEEFNLEYADAKQIVINWMRQFTR